MAHRLISTNAERRAFRNIRRAVSVALFSSRIFFMRFRTSGVMPPPLLLQTIKTKNPAPVLIGSLALPSGIFWTTLRMLIGSLEVSATSRRPDCLEPSSPPFLAKAENEFTDEEICLATFTCAFTSPGGGF